jgi:hypothetical protein
LSDIYKPVDARLSQGDILAVAAHVLVSTLEEAKIGSGEEPVAVKSAMAIVTTNDCTLDKRKTKYAQICPVVPVSEMSGALLNDLRLNKIFQYLHLPRFGEIPESFIDFGMSTTVDISLLRSAQRLWTLSDMGRQAFFSQMIRYITRWELKTVSCPACQSQFDLSMTMAVRADD